MDDVLARGFHFTAAASKTSPKSHFSTLKSMKEWIAAIMQPYVTSIIEANPDLPKDQNVLSNTVKSSVYFTELQDASIQGLVEVYNFMNTFDGRDIVKMVKFCFTDKQSLLIFDAGIEKYLLKDPELQNKIKQCLGKVQRINKTAEIELDAEQYDDMDVPISTVIHEKLGIVISREADGHDSMEKIKTYEGELITNGLEEDIWRYNQAENRWDNIENGMVQVEFLEDSECTETQKGKGCINVNCQNPSCRFGWGTLCFNPSYGLLFKAHRVTSKGFLVKFLKQSRKAITSELLVASVTVQGFKSFTAIPSDLKSLG
ncbi:hypothetical protein ARMGADRAFT_1026700 [Armillaria gallica]|uniref:Uncharacterized protein n=1 Tax=Armillaria gallica TaxID=47427 RepID=A0A2H3E6N2_ARMGA|nr:hypothetical protein ARMGADRAFT_1026700 [Armillaria gallica]